MIVRKPVVRVSLIRAGIYTEFRLHGSQLVDRTSKASNFEWTSQLFSWILRVISEEVEEVQTHTLVFFGSEVIVSFLGWLGGMFRGGLSTFDVLRDPNGLYGDRKPFKWWLRV